jgi:hypothetical protein
MVGKKSRFVAVLALMMVPSVAFGAAVTVKGRLEGTKKLLNPVWNEAKEPTNHRYTFREPSVTTRVDARTLTSQLDKELAIVAIGDSGGKAKGSMIVMGGRISPVTLVVAQNEQVQIENKDPFPHRLYDTGNKGMPVGETPANKARTWTPPGPGKYEIRDQAAPSVRAWIVVEAKAVATAYPDRKGEFAIDLEPGKYKLRAYHNGDMVGKELDVVVNPAPAEQPLKNPLVVAEDKKDEKK